MNGQQRFEMVTFFKECEVINKRSKTSSYFEVKYKDYIFKFCISDHFAEHRKKLLTIISKDRTTKKAKHIAYAMYKQQTPTN